MKACRSIRLIVLLCVPILFLTCNFGYSSQYRIEAYTTNKTISHRYLGNAFEAQGIYHYTAADELIKVAYSLYKTDAKFSFCKQLIPDTLSLNKDSSLDFSTTGNWIYFSANRDIYRVNTEGSGLENITRRYDQNYINPQLSNDDRYLSFVNNINAITNIICVLDQNTGIMHEYPSLTTRAKKAVFRSTDQRLYYLTGAGLWSASLSDTISVLEKSFTPDNNLTISNDDRFIIVNGNNMSYLTFIYIKDTIDDTWMTVEKIYGYYVAKKANALIYSTYDKAMYYDFENQVNRVAFAKGVDDKKLSQILSFAPNWNATKLCVKAEYND